jgi:hypothetical protein
LLAFLPGILCLSLQCLVVPNLDDSSPAPIPVLAYRRADAVRRSRYSRFRRRMRWLASCFWLAQFACVIWLLMGAAMMVSTLVETLGLGPRFPIRFRMEQFAVELLATVPGVLLLMLLRISHRRPRRSGGGRHGCRMERF